MIKKITGIIVGIIIIILVLAGCGDNIRDGKYKIEDLPGYRQYILTTPEGIKYTTYENSLWYPKDLYGDGTEYIGRCKAGRIYETTSDISLYIYKRGGIMPIYIFRTDAVLPELNIDNINNIVLEDSRNGYFKIAVDLQNGEKLLGLYHNNETHEILKLGTDFEIMKVIFESEQYRGLFFSRSIYKNGTKYYMHIKNEYDSVEDKTTRYYVECTSIIENILGNN